MLNKKREFMKLTIVNKSTKQTKTFIDRPKSFQEANNLVWENSRFSEEWDFVLIKKNIKYIFDDEDNDWEKCVDYVEGE